MKIRITNSLIFLFAVLFGTGNSVVYAQDATEKSNADDVPAAIAEKPAESQLMIAGLTTFGFVNQTTTNTLGGVKSTNKNNSFGDADNYELSPMFLWRHGDNLLVEFEPSFTGTTNGPSLGVNWADVSYVVSPGLIIRGGYLVIPFGIYAKRLAAGWIDKLASDPINIADAPGSDFGIEVMGGLPMGNMKWSYDVSLTNGFQLNQDGTTSGVGISAITNGKTGSGRLGLLPFSNSCLEIGISGLYGSLAYAPGVAPGTIAANETYNNPAMYMYAFDLSFVKNINPIQINVKGQYQVTNVNKQNYISPVDSTQTYTFNNNTTAYFGQISLRPTGSKNKILKNVEVAFRYVDYTAPQNSTWGENYSEEDYGIDYWLSWRTVLKCTYENIYSTGTSSSVIAGQQGTTSISRVIVQFSTEF